MSWCENQNVKCENKAAWMNVNKSDSWSTILRCLLSVSLQFGWQDFVTLTMITLTRVHISFTTISPSTSKSNSKWLHLWTGLKVILYSFTFLLCVYQPMANAHELCHINKVYIILYTVSPSFLQISIFLSDPGSSRSLVQIIWMQNDDSRALHPSPIDPSLYPPYYANYQQQGAGRIPQHLNPMNYSSPSSQASENLGSPPNDSFLSMLSSRAAGKRPASVTPSESNKKARTVDDPAFTTAKGGHEDTVKSKSTRGSRWV